MTIVHTKFWTLCLIKDGDRVLLIDRQHDDFKGFIPPGGKVEFPESFTEAAIREVKEETGLEVKNLQYKGIYEYVNPERMERFIIFNYLATEFTGELLKKPAEGIPTWIALSDVPGLPMQASIRRRFPYLLRKGTFEIHVTWDESRGCEGDVSITVT
ncbi:8-oxo-dGTP diphosphatase [Rossellomorea marisflavi]|uniref:8-oxo-dGTP diphosphatase n=1 Tax=Rossellomorea marisflavi TaxID=189381 RepID=UPI000B2F1EF0|nr:8-oxo-dGTP diphosphatase [Rossellomorea marisflavi]MCM2589082.1 8-oxo-dGTP diphosphatase [Rossellomorea marisflavi]VXB04803.1 DNA mismatch repair protein MutT [Bacillus sp. 349Y]